MYDIINDNWEEIINRLTKEYGVSGVSLKSWILPLKLHSVEGKTVNIIFNGENCDFAIPIITSKYSTLFKIIIEEITGQEFDIKILSPNSFGKAVQVTEYSDNVTPRLESSRLNPKYDFDSFVVGYNNNLAYAAALAVAETPGHKWNPLFIYGGVGLGKTHLLQAIGNFIIKNNPELKVLYTHSETFTNEVIDILRGGNKDNTAISNFRNKYRNIDIFLVDDIQFIIGKDRTQEEFFHTFNTLYLDGKQIVITSDKPPKEMATLEERFKTRFSEGVTVDIQSPDYETRMAILKLNAEQMNYHIDEFILKYIADNIKSNIRELEGALNKIVLYSRINTDHEITLEVAKEALKDVISPHTDDSVINMEYIVKTVADHFNISEADIYGPRKTKDISVPRQICMYLCYQYVKCTYKEIATSLNREDHSTAVYTVKKIENRIKNEPDFKATIDILKKKLNK